MTDEEATLLLEESTLRGMGQAHKPPAKKKRPGFLKRVARGAGKIAKATVKYHPLSLAAKASAAIVTAPVRFIVKKFLNTLAGRRARYLAYQRRGTQKPNPSEVNEAKAWTKKWVSSRGGPVFKLMQKLKIAGDTAGVNASMGHITHDQLGQVVEVATAVGTAAVLALVTKLLALATKEGAPKEIRTKPPEAAQEQQAFEETVPSAPPQEAEEAESEAEVQGILWG
jgi:hypothetical protein